MSDGTATRPVGRALWLDVARIAAILGVITIHVVSGTAESVPPDVTTTAQRIALIMLAAVTWCVPLFVMISGALLLDRADSTDVGVFYRRRFGRFLLPAVVWCLVYWAWRVTFRDQDVSVSDFLGTVLAARPYAHLHYLFIVLGLYLITPMLSVFVRAASRDQLRFAVVLALVLGSAQQSLAVVDLSARPNIVTHFVPYIGYYLAGLLLRDVRLDRRQSLAAIGLVLGTVVLGVAGSIAFGSAFGADEAMVPLAYLSPTTILATLALFVLFRTWLGPERPATARAPAWVGTIAAATFGVYLLHPIVLDLWRTVIPIGAGRFSVLVVFPASVAVVGAASLVVVLIARQIPLVRRLVP